MVDVNILIANVVWPLWPYEVLQHVLRNDFRLVLSEYIVKQARRRISKIFPAYLDQFDQLLKASQYE